MTRKANRGRGGKKISKVLDHKAMVDLEIASRFVNCDVDLVEEEENCENLTLCDNEKVLKLDMQSLPSSSKVDMEVVSSFPEVGDVSYAGEPVVESPIQIDPKNVA